jgi:hypothetical protein
VQIHHLVLKRLDGSEYRRDHVALLGDIPRVGATIAVAVAPTVQVAARVTRVETMTVLARDGTPTRPHELTVHAQETMSVPVAANEPWSVFDSAERLAHGKLLILQMRDGQTALL